MSSLKRLASQTLIYGGSTILGRFLSAFLGFWLTYVYKDSPDQFAVFTLAYAYVTFLNIVFTYGLETSYFRFIQQEGQKDIVFNTSMLSLFSSTILLSGGMMLFAPEIADLWRIPDNPEYVTWFAWIIAFDTIAAIPFAKLRAEGRPMRFAMIKFASIAINVALAYFFIGVCPDIARSGSNSPILLIYDETIGVGYTFIANLIASAATVLLLLPEFKRFEFRFSGKLWMAMLRYSWPLLIVGIGGMINEVLSRILLDYRLPFSFIENKVQVGIFNANLKIAALVNIFLQVYRTGAEPFFFSEAGQKDAQKNYARLMKFFVIAGCIVFLSISLFAESVWGQLLLGGDDYREGLGVIPILALAYVFLGIYYNLTVWYKLTDKTIYGAYITVMGAVITIVLNYLTIPIFGYWGSAFATLLCYGSMMFVSYKQGQKYYPVPYPVKKLIGYVMVSLIAYFVYFGITQFTDNLLALFIVAAILLILFLLFVGRIERKDFSRLPIIGKMYRTPILAQAAVDEKKGTGV